MEEKTGRIPPQVASFQFFVGGVPATQGSKQIVGAVDKTGRPIGRGRMIDSCKTLGAWRTDVKAIAGQNMRKAGFKFCPKGVPIALELTFTFMRPDSHYGKKKGERYKKPTAPRWHTSTKDLIKMARAIEDSITKIVYEDDKQVCCYRKLEKIYVNSGAGVYAKVIRLDIPEEAEPEW